MAENAKTPLDLLNEAQDSQLRVVGGYRLNVLKSQDDLNKFRGKDDYQISVATIVKEYPDGIVLTRLREVLPDSAILDEAIKKLVEKKEIISEPNGKRSQLLKPVRQAPEAQPPPTSLDVSPNIPPVARAEEKPAITPTKPEESASQM